MLTNNNHTLSESQISATTLFQQSTNNLNASNLNVDILWRNRSTGSNAAWLMNGTTHEAGLTMISPDPSWKIAATADFNWDGQDDILWRNSLTGENAIWVMSDSSTIAQGVWLTQVHDTSWQIESTTDFNRDGSTDILWRNYRTGENAIWEMNGSSLKNGVWLTQVHDTSWQIESTTDFNRDGNTDILWRNSRTGENAIWEMNGSSLSNGVWLTQVSDTSWQIESTADFSRDGNTDILWRNSQTGENAIWNMNGSSLKNGIWLDRIGDTNWQIETAADFNNDGHVDILWRNHRTGQNSVWTMNGTTRIENVTLTAIADTDWQIAGIIKHNTIEANNTLDTASNLGTINGLRTITNYAGSNDLQDYYRFIVNSASTFRLDLSGLSGDLDIILLDASSRTLSSSEKWYTSDESIRTQLAAGTYYVQVYAFGSSNYTLNLSLLDGFNNTYGYGLVNADAAVARAIGENAPGNYTYDWGNFTGGNWGNNAVNAPEAWARGYTGKDITVAVIDSGVDINHSDLNDNIWRNVSEIIGNGIDDDGNGYIDDINGWNTGLNNNNILPIDTHGTHVTGTIAGENNGTGVTGVAYNSDIMAIRVFDNATDANIAQGIRYAVDNGARVINMSLGEYFYTPEILDALAYAASRNVIAVIAAGNEYDDYPSIAYEPSYPANFATDYGISVGAININGNITDFSNRAGKNSDMLHVVAPGQEIKSTIPGGGYESYKGTSMAAPHVAGVVALMLDANPHLSHTQVRQIIAETAARAI